MGTKVGLYTRGLFIKFIPFGVRPVLSLIWLIDPRQEGTQSLRSKDCLS